MSNFDRDLVHEQPQTSQSQQQKSSRGWRGWIIVLLLLLLLFGCILAQMLFPDRRGPVVTLPSEGLVHVFSIYGLNEPRGVAAGPDGRMAVSDTGAQRAYIYDSNGVLMTRLGGELPADRVFSVTGSMFEEGTVYLCDWGLKRVWMFA